MGRSSSILLRMVTRVQACWAAMVLLVALGCESKGRPPVVAVPPPQSQTSSIIPRVWTPRPIRMRVYPATRFVKGQGRLILDAMIELSDEMGDPVKGAGEFRLQLIDQQRASESPIGKTLYAWQIAVSSIEDQKRTYDRITRTYRFRLQLEERTVPSRRCLLRAQLLGSDNSLLEAELVLNTAQRQSFTGSAQRDYTQTESDR